MGLSLQMVHEKCPKIFRITSRVQNSADKNENAKELPQVAQKNCRWSSSTQNCGHEKNGWSILEKNEGFWGFKSYDCEEF